MLLPRPPRQPNERRILTLDLDEKPGDPQTPVGLWSPLDERPGVMSSATRSRRLDREARLVIAWIYASISATRAIVAPDVAIKINEKV